MGSQYHPAHRIRCHLTERTGIDGDAPLTPAAAWRCDLSDDSLTWSVGVFDLFGLPRFMAVDRRDIVEMYEPESRALLEKLRSEAIATCGSFTFEARIKRFDSEMRWIRITADIDAEQGKARYLYGLKQDVTAEMAGIARRSRGDDVARGVGSTST